MILWYDYETYFDQEYSLNNMTTTEYINDERFEAHGMSAAIDNEPEFWIDRDDLPYFWKDVENHVHMTCNHNAMFDARITSMHYTKKRWLLCCTQAMAQGSIAMKFPGQRVSLLKLTQFYWPDDPSMWKIEDGTAGFKGYHFDEMPQFMRDNMQVYAKGDTRVMRNLFYRLMQEQYPWHTALEDIDIFLAMSVHPQMRMNRELAAAINAEETRKKEQAVQELGIDRADLRSNDKFADILISLGVPPPTKLNAKGLETYAFAKKDVDFINLLEHDDPQVRAVVELRLGEKSAQAMNRSAVFARLPELLPVPTVYGAAHTGRTGGDEFNMLNMSRSSGLRACPCAWPGHKLVAMDAAQIELRLNAWFCDEQTILSALIEGRDIYSELASVIFNMLITKKDNPDERFVGKTGELACQYGAGENRIYAALVTDKVPGASREMAKKIKTSYRRTRTKIVGMWSWLNDVAIPALAGLIPAVQHKGLTFSHENGKGRILLPSGRSLWYPDIRVNESGDWEYRFCKRRGAPYWKKVYGGLLLENIIQALAYDVYTFQLRLASRRLEFQPCLSVYDEAVYHVRDEAVPWVMDELKDIGAMKPEWLDSWLPLVGEVGFGQTYADAK